MAAETTSLLATEESDRLERSIGFWGLTFVSLGSIIGSGWLLGALGAATVDARLSYALGQEEVLPNQLTMVNKKRVPVYSILLAFVVGLIFFLPSRAGASSSASSHQPRRSAGRP
jgi:amino acid transporter